MKKNNNLSYDLIPIILLFLFLAFFPASSPAQNQSGEEKEAERLLKFAGNLLGEGDYYRAITEYKRFISYYPLSPKIPDARIGIANSYYKAEKYSEAIDSYRDFLNKYPENARLEEAILNLANSFIKTKDRDSAMRLLNEIEKEMPDSDVAEKLKLLLGKNLIREGRYEDAERELGNIKEKSGEKEDADKLLENLKGVKELKLKSPMLAGLMSSVLPGAGQVYSGRKKDAVFAFLLNGLFAWGAIESFNRDIYVAGAILSFFEFGWYTGNIYNAVSNTHKYNRKLQNNYLDNALALTMKGRNFLKEDKDLKSIAFKIHF